MYKITKYMEINKEWVKIKHYRYDSEKTWKKCLQNHKDGVNGLRFKFVSEKFDGTKWIKVDTWYSKGIVGKNHLKTMDKLNKQINEAAGTQGLKWI